MATQNQFLGFKKILSTAKSSMVNNYLYFVRDNGSAVEGELWFNGTCYGKCRDVEIDDIKRTLADFLSGGTASGTTVKDYIDTLIGRKDASVTGTSSDGHVTIQIDEADGALTAATVTTVDIASASATTQELNTIEEAVGLSTDGSHIQSSGRYTSGATTTEGEIAALDTALQAVADKTITEGSSTENYVNLSVASSATGTAISIDDSALKTAIEAMDYSGVTANGQAIVNVTETDGKITATQGDIAAEHVTIADAGSLFTATNVEDALAEIDAAYKAADEAIVGDATEIGNTLGKLEDRIEELSADAKEYHIVKTETGLPAEIKERYSLVDADGNVSGDTIDVPKDSHIVSINYISTSGDPHYQNLEYVYIDASGNTQTTYVDMSELVLESEFASGVTSIDGIVRGVVDSTSETFLTVGTGGFKLSGVQDAIDDAKTAATAYTQSEIQKLDVTGDTEVAGQYVAAIEETDGVVAVKTRANVSEAVLNNYAKGTDATAVAATDTVNQAISKLENQVDAAKAAATTKVEKDSEAIHLTLTSSTASDGSVTYTIGEDDIASATALTAEIAARKAVDGQSGDTYSANTSANYISSATSLNDADLKLDTALKAVADQVAGLDYTGVTDENTKVVTDVKQEDGLVSASATTVGNLVITAITTSDAKVAANDNLATIAGKLQGQINAMDLAVVSGTGAAIVSVSEEDGKVSATTGNVNTDHVVLASDITGTSMSAATGTEESTVLQQIVNAIDNLGGDALTGVTSTGETLRVDAVSGNKQNIEFVKEAPTDTTVADGHLELAQNNSKEWYGVMYWIDEEGNA